MVAHGRDGGFSLAVWRRGAGGANQEGILDRVGLEWSFARVESRGISCIQNGRGQGHGGQAPSQGSVAGLLVSSSGRGLESGGLHVTPASYS